MLYFLAMETTSRRLAATSSFLAWSLTFFPAVMARTARRSDSGSSPISVVCFRSSRLASRTFCLRTGSSFFFLARAAAQIVAGVLEVVDGLEPAPQLLDDLLAVGRAEVEVADRPADLDDDPAAADEGLLLLRDAVELPAEVPDPLDLAQDLLLLLLELALGDVLLGDVEHLLDDERVLLDPVLEGQDLVEDEAGPAEGLDDALLAPLDLAGDGDLALAGQERDVAHLAEVELDRVGRPLQAVRRDEVALAPLGEHLLLARVEDLDPVVAHRRQEIVEILLGVEVLGEGLVDLLEQQVALLAALRDELGDLVLVELIVRRHGAHLFSDR